jgi:hypothetical protein
MVQPFFYHEEILFCKLCGLEFSTFENRRSVDRTVFYVADINECDTDE